MRAFTALVWSKSSKTFEVLWKCNEIDNLPLPLRSCYCLSSEMFFDSDNQLPVFLGYFPCLTRRTEHTSTSEDYARVWCRNMLFTGSYFAFARPRRHKSRHFRHSLIIISIDKSFKNSIEIHFKLHPYLNRIYVSRINIELLSVWTQICACFAFDNAVKLATIQWLLSRASDSVFLFVSGL
jgi:hypothetical protein